MCCSSIHSPKGIFRMLVRIGFGLSLLFVGIAHYRDASFVHAVGSGLGSLEPLGTLWGYLIPVLFVVGGVLLTLGLYMDYAAWAAGLGLVSLPAGLMLKSVISGAALGDTMPAAMNAFIWILVLGIAVKGGCCGGMCSGGSCDTGTMKKTAGKKK